jgi:hypothetical protein
MHIDCPGCEANLPIDQQLDRTVARFEARVEALEAKVAQQAATIERLEAAEPEPEPTDIIRCPFCGTAVWHERWDPATGDRFWSHLKKGDCAEDVAEGTNGVWRKIRDEVKEQAISDLIEKIANLPGITPEDLELLEEITGNGTLIVGTCRDCVHWRLAGYAGLCGLGESKNDTPAVETTLAFAGNALCPARLYTQPNFGCIQFAPRGNNEAMERAIAAQQEAIAKLPEPQRSKIWK